MLVGWVLFVVCFVVNMYGFLYKLQGVNPGLARRFHRAYLFWQTSWKHKVAVCVGLLTAVFFINLAGTRAIVYGRLYSNRMANGLAHYFLSSTHDRLWQKMADRRDVADSQRAFGVEKGWPPSFVNPQLLQAADQQGNVTAWYSAANGERYPYWPPLSRLNRLDMVLLFTSALRNNVQGARVNRWGGPVFTVAWGSLWFGGEHKWIPDGYFECPPRPAGVALDVGRDDMSEQKRKVDKGCALAVFPYRAKAMRAPEYADVVLYHRSAGRFDSGILPPGYESLYTAYADTVFKKHVARSNLEKLKSYNPGKKRLRRSKNGHGLLASQQVRLAQAESMDDTRPEADDAGSEQADKTEKRSLIQAATEESTDDSSEIDAMVEDKVAAWKAKNLNDGKFVPSAVLTGRAWSEDPSLRWPHGVQRHALFAAENFASMFLPDLTQPFDTDMSYRGSALFRDGGYEIVGLMQADAWPLTATKWSHLFVQPPIRTPWRRSQAKEQRSTVSWASTHCGSRSGRERLVYEMRAAGLDVDVWGTTCLANKQTWDAEAQQKPPSVKDASDVVEATEHEIFDPKRSKEEQLWRSYKFHVVFENSICEDYVTEKAFLAWTRGQVPIVLSAPNFQEYAPSRDSYIAVSDFDSVEALVDHVLAVDADDALYEKYHAWRDRPFSTYGWRLRDTIYALLPLANWTGAGPSASATWFACDMCRALEDEARTPQAEQQHRPAPVEPLQCWAPLTVEGTNALPQVPDNGDVGAVPEAEVGKTRRSKNERLGIKINHPRPRAKEDANGAMQATNLGLSGKDYILNEPDRPPGVPAVRDTYTEGVAHQLMVRERLDAIAATQKNGGGNIRNTVHDVDWASRARQVEKEKGVS